MFNWSGSSRLPIANYLIFLFPTVAFVFYFPLHKSFLETALGNKLFLESFHVCDRALLTVIYKHTLKTIISLDKPPNPTIKNENRHLRFQVFFQSGQVEFGLGHRARLTNFFSWDVDLPSTDKSRVRCGFFQFGYAHQSTSLLVQLL